MSTKTKLQNLEKVKQDLADKYKQLSKIAGSKVKQKHFQSKSAEYAIQAVRLRRKLDA